MYPVSGSFYAYSVRFIDPSWGFAMGWNYVLQVRLMTSWHWCIADPRRSGLLSYHWNLLYVV